MEFIFLKYCLPDDLEDYGFASGRHNGSKIEAVLPADDLAD